MNGRKARALRKLTGFRNGMPRGYQERVRHGETQELLEGLDRFFTPSEVLAPGPRRAYQVLKTKGGTPSLIGREVALMARARPDLVARQARP